jgi:hypothetical protein
MSYDIDIGSESFNYTWNLGRFFRAHIEGDGLNGLDGLTGKQAHAALRTAFYSIDREYIDFCSPERSGARRMCAKYDPPNGWGSTFGATLFLARLMAACAANPRCKVRVS